MPLPAALLARLAKRGIVEAEAEAETTTKSQQHQQDPSKPDEEEEVFAEDYDDPSKPEVPEVVPEPVVELQPEPVPQPPPGVDVVGQEPVFFETTACPNRYGLRDWNPDADMIKRRDRMLRKYPLPEGWLEVGDHDSSRYYYWNMYTDDVSWLSPTHPKARALQSAEKLGLIGKVGNLDSDGEDGMDTQSLPEDNASESGSNTSLSDEEEMEEESSSIPIPTNKIESRFGALPPHQTNQNQNQNQSRQNESRRSQKKVEELDPMDPASYSEIERGGWNDGLDMRGKAKTGVDVTASGPLFQQRPYPSPGDILRANQSIKKKK